MSNKAKAPRIVSAQLTGIQISYVGGGGVGMDLFRNDPIQKTFVAITMHANNACKHSAMPYEICFDNQLPSCIARLKRKRETSIEYSK